MSKDELCSCGSKVYKVDQGVLCLAERLVLRVLHWDLNLITVTHFMEVVLSPTQTAAGDYDKSVELMLKSCVFGTNTSFPPSVMAAAILSNQDCTGILPCFKTDANVLRCAALVVGGKHESGPNQ
jgi:hypothetical protein